MKDMNFEVVKHSLPTLRVTLPPEVTRAFLRCFGNPTRDQRHKFLFTINELNEIGESAGRYTERDDEVLSDFYDGLSKYIYSDDKLEGE